MHEAARYEHQAEKAVSHRWRKQYASTAGRLMVETIQLKSALLDQGEALERRIIEERKLTHKLIYNPLCVSISIFGSLILIIVWSNEAHT